ncbi:carbon-nitrogen hydrolase [Stutzerimonas tarimensis]|uniref:Carbon-nitrogen hydrolase n=1 Tax=Stutzerimonas tarimensis TaxID=1507735 RepID=A0ABV7T2Q7_9GAMM
MRIRILFLTAAILGLISLGLYLQWTQDRRAGPLLSDLRPLTIEHQGSNRGLGNLLAIEVRLLPADYQSPERLHLRFASHLRQAQDAGLLGSQTVVALPEHVGTGLFAIGEKPEVQQARTLRDAMQWMALSNPLGYLRALLGNHGEDRRTEAVLRMKARGTAAAYQSVFADLAREFEVTLVAGSLVLPEPYLSNGRLRPGSGPLRQVAAVFSPEGTILEPLLIKHHLSRYEQRYSAASHVARWYAEYETPAGSLTVMLGCDDPRQESERPAVAALIGSDCAPLPGAQHQVQVGTLGLPWNLAGSPRRPNPVVNAQPGRMLNAWIGKDHNSVASSASSE